MGISGCQLQFEFMGSCGMAHIAARSMKEVLSSLSRSSVQFQGHNGWKSIWITFEITWPVAAIKPSYLPCCYKEDKHIVLYWCLWLLVRLSHGCVFILVVHEMKRKKRIHLWRWTGTTSSKSQFNISWTPLISLQNCSSIIPVLHTSAKYWCSGLRKGLCTWSCACLFVYTHISLCLCATNYWM